MENRLRFFVLLLAIFVQDSKGEGSCGRSLEKHLQSRIIQGTDVGYYKYPWFGVVKANGTLKCGCTLVNDQYALTTTNCFRDYLPLKADQNLVGVFTVTLGVYNRCSEAETTRKTFVVEKVIIHQDFVKGKRANNIALLKLSSPTGFEPACLPSGPVAVANRPSEGTIVGLGMLNYEALERSCTVQEGRVLIYDNQKCENALKNIGEDPGLLSKGFCAGGAQDTKPYGCGIDLGGPLTVRSNNNTLYILGIISYKRCPDNGNITLYVDVSQYLDWIHKTIGDHQTTQQPFKEYPDYYDDSDTVINPKPDTPSTNTPISPATTPPATSPPAPTPSATTPPSVIVTGKARHGGHHHGEKKHHGERRFHHKH